MNRGVPCACAWLAGRALVVLGFLMMAGRADGGGVRVILISVDGLRADVISEETAPNLAALRAAGVSAGEALNDLPSATLPNHATMLTGLVTDRHGLILNIVLPGTIPQLTLFDFAAEAGLRSAFFASKTKLGHLAPPGALEIIAIDGDTEPLVARLIEQITPDGPDLIFAHLRDPDSVGHRDGWLTSPYMEAVAQIDRLIGEIAAAAASDDSRPTYVIVTADHGGDGANHFLNIAANRRIPWIVTGPDIPAGRVLEATVSIADTTPTVLWLLGAEVPAGLSGRVVSAVRNPIDDESARVTSVAPVGIPCLILVVPLMPAAFWLTRRSGRRIGCERRVLR